MTDPKYKSHKYSFRFVCQGGGLDVKSAILAASLVENLRCNCELRACVPTGKDVPKPLPSVIGFLTDLNIPTVPIKNHIGPHYPIGHKMSCLYKTDEPVVRVFLDSDILCLKRFYGFPNQPQVELMAKLEDWNHHTPYEWERLYTYFGLGPVSTNYRSTVLGEPMPLYFNAGVLVVSAESDLPSRWIDAARRMDIELDIPRKMPNLDQLSLAALVVKHRVPHSLLAEDYNFPGELRPLDHHRLPYFCHYHDPLMVFADAYLSRTICHLSKQFPALGRIIRDYDGHGWFKAALMHERAVFS